MFFNGQMSSAFIFDRVLSADEVAVMYAFPYAMFEPPGPPYILAPPIAPLYNTSQGMFGLMAGH